MRRLQSFALGGLNWSPGDFWRATPHDLMAAVEFNERRAARIESERREAGH